MRWLLSLAGLLSGLVAGPLLLLLLLINTPPGLGPKASTYRLFALLVAGAFAVAPIGAVGLALSRGQRRWFRASLLLLVLPAVAMVLGAAWAALLLWG